MKTSFMQRSLAWKLVCSSLFLFVFSWTLAQEVLTDCQFSQPYSLDANGLVTLEHYLNPSERTFTMRVTYRQGHSWIGVGMNLDNGASHTTSTYAVIGSVQQEGVDGKDSYVGEAYRYYMDSTAADGSGVSRLSDFGGHIQNSSFVQNSSNQGDEISILEFTHALVLRNESSPGEVLYQITVPSQPADGGGDDNNNGVVETGRTDNGGRNLQQATRFLWAVGLPTNQWTGYHELHGSFTLDELPSLSFCVVLANDTPSETPAIAAQTNVDGEVSSAEWFEDESENGGGEIDFVEDDDGGGVGDLLVAGNELQDPVAHLWVRRF
jgi:hypothetical protein